MGKNLEISIKQIPAKRQRYRTLGDYFYNKNILSILVNQELGEKAFCAVALHEFVESTLCRFRGIPEVDITNWDIGYEKTREREFAPCGCKHYEEPGDDPHAPYWREHQLATTIERMYIHDLGQNWGDYEQRLAEEED